MTPAFQIFAYLSDSVPRVVDFILKGFRNIFGLSSEGRKKASYHASLLNSFTPINESTN